MAAAPTPFNVLIVRAWVQPGSEAALRVRVIQPSEHGNEHIITTSSIDEACWCLRRWLGDVLASADG
jgi:hypothetical protein